MKCTIRLHNTLSELEYLNEQLDRVGELWQLPKKTIYHINLVLDELFTNTVSYGYSDDSDHIVSITLENKSDKVLITMIDDGHAFDPTQQRTHDLGLPPEDRELGGLGIFLVQQYIDEITYSDKDGNNNIHMVKKLTNNE